MTVFDANVGLGHWPFRKLPVETPNGLHAELTRAGIDHALVYSLNAVFYKDVHSGNRELSVLSGEKSWARIAAVINPTHTGAEDDLNEAIEQLDARAVRLFPGYHRYRLDDPLVGDFLSRLQDRRPGLPVLITVRLEDERLHRPVARVPAPDLAVVPSLAKRFPKLAIILMCIQLGEAQKVQDALSEGAAVYYEISRMTNSEFLPTVLDAIPAQRLIFGTNLPLFVPECAVLKISKPDAPEQIKKKIFYANLAALIGDIPAGSRRSAT